jgi:hypothetical protein
MSLSKEAFLENLRRGAGCVPAPEEEEIEITTSKRPRGAKKSRVNNETHQAVNPQGRSNPKDVNPHPQGRSNPQEESVVSVVTPRAEISNPFHSNNLFF